MSKSSRLNYKIDPELKERLQKYAGSQGRGMNEVMDEFLRTHLDIDSSTPEKEQDQLERDLERIDSQLGKLQEADQDTQAMHTVVQNLMEMYSNLNQDFRKIRLQAISDYRSSPEPIGNRLGVKSEKEIREACQFFLQVTDLQKKKTEIETRLGILLGVEVKPSTSFTPKKGENGIEQSDTSLPTFRVMLDFDKNDFCCWVTQVRPRKGNLKPLTFPDGTRGLVYEVRRSDYPKTRSIELHFEYFGGYPFLTWFDPSQVEALTVTAMVQLTRTQADALKQILKDSKPDGEAPYIYWREFATPDQLRGFDESEKLPPSRALDEPPERLEEQS